MDAALDDINRIFFLSCGCVSLERGSGNALIQHLLNGF